MSLLIDLKGRGGYYPFFVAGLLSDPEKIDGLDQSFILNRAVTHQDGVPRAKDAESLTEN